jgi:RNA 2',3'-cyclic 3'-phosphodiesterase
MLRLFAALPVPDPIADRVKPLQTGLDGAKWSPPENLHITLRFLGNVDERKAEDVDSELGAIRLSPFEIETKGIGHFGGDTPHAMWLGVEPTPALLALNKACERACRRAGLVAEARAYTPHMTICYLPRLFPVERVMKFQSDRNLVKLPVWTADRFYLYASHTSANGPSRYTIMAEYPLTY